MLLLQLLVDGLQLGAIYALMAVGFAVIFGATRVFHYAHGTSYVIVGYLFYYLAERLHLAWWAAAAAASAAGVVFGVLLDRWMYRPIQRDEGSFFTVFVASFGIAVVAENVIVILFGASFVSISTPLTRANDIGGGIVISHLGILSMLIAVGLFTFLNWFLAKTDVGVALRALSENPELVRSFGLNPRKLSQYAFAIGSLLVAPAALVATCVTGLTPTAGHRVVLISIAASIIGGIGSLRGAGLGGLILGLAESLAVWKLSTGWSEAVAFVILFAFILARPSGLFGSKARV
ncbi:MAG: branched-chain amino acid transport system permease protein [Hyphomicrobiales bacterium]|jgi:branched-chain amino acid transport system permease protein|nr:branched-chain amino acid transport system permease protein [Hyphomicrobiales bacterium]